MQAKVSISSEFLLGWRKKAADPSQEKKVAHGANCHTLPPILLSGSDEQLFCGL